MLRWKVFGSGVPDAYVYAESFDEALEKARKQDPRYNGGQVDGWKAPDKNNVDCAWR